MDTSYERYWPKDLLIYDRWTYQPRSIEIFPLVNPFAEQQRNAYEAYLIALKQLLHFFTWRFYHGLEPVCTDEGHLALAVLGHR
jgi:hypothetical protein